MIPLISEISISSPSSVGSKKKTIFAISGIFRGTPSSKIITTTGSQSNQVILINSVEASTSWRGRSRRALVRIPIACESRKPCWGKTHSFTRNSIVSLVWAQAAPSVVSKGSSHLITLSRSASSNTPADSIAARLGVAPWLILYNHRP